MQYVPGKGTGGMSEDNGIVICHDHNIPVVIYYIMDMLYGNVKGTCSMANYNITKLYD